MRTWLVAVALLPLAACSDSTEDPLAEKCKSTCQIDDTHPCYDGGKGVEACVKACRNMAGSVERNPAYIKGCAECLAGEVKYAVTTDPGCSPTSGGSACCYPGYVIQPIPGDSDSAGWTACAAMCFEPDGGPAY